MKLADALAAAGRIDGWIMAPIDTTSLKLAKVCEDIDELQPADTYMFRISGPLRIVPLTEHIPLRAVPDTVTPERVRAVVELVGATLKRWGVDSPRIGVAGLNPHAVGTEDSEVLARFTRAVRESSAVDQRSGVSARFASAAAEAVWAAALGRCRRIRCSARGSRAGMT